MHHSLHPDLEAEPSPLYLSYMRPVTEVHSNNWAFASSLDLGSLDPNTRPAQLNQICKRLKLCFGFMKPKVPKVPAGKSPISVSFYSFLLHKFFVLLKRAERWNYSQTYGELISQKLRVLSWLKFCF
ncbi:hypothetical protein TRP8649_02343 [Pelagimonas phthalicica]|uniref:Uncharacterized protein n=1 Tax=Pelagimonas phthalicica TaxID=1037362 RepID=A0A238JDJ7_9RHOB|nr:hypothetical protein TRP8649_02343 [Pelagimonas phthalicica]